MAVSGCVSFATCHPRVGWTPWAYFPHCTESCCCVMHFRYLLCIGLRLGQLGGDCILLLIKPVPQPSCFAFGFCHSSSDLVFEEIIREARSSSINISWIWASGICRQYYSDILLAKVIGHVQNTDASASLFLYSALHYLHVASTG